MSDRLSLACRALAHHECRVYQCWCPCHHVPDPYADRSTAVPLADILPGVLEACERWTAESLDRAGRHLVDGPNGPGWCDQDGCDGWCSYPGPCPNLT